jgi:hypothetical protein
VSLIRCRAVWFSTENKNNAAQEESMLRVSGPVITTSVIFTMTQMAKQYDEAHGTFYK